MSTPKDPKVVTVGRVSVRLLPAKAGPVFVSIPSKAAAEDLAADVMGVSDLGRDLATALRRVTFDEPEPTLVLSLSPDSSDRALLAALRGLEDPDEPGRFCEHAAAPCHRCDAARVAIAKAEGR